MRWIKVAEVAKRCALPGLQNGEKRYRLVAGADNWENTINLYLKLGDR